MCELNVYRKFVGVALLLLLLLLGRQFTDRAHAAKLPKPATQNLIGWTGIVFQTYRHGNWDIYLSGPPDGEVRLTNHGAADTLPRLSMGGTKIAFVSDRDGNDEIYTMNLDGSAQTRLTYDGASDSVPYWSPDGQQLIFMSQRTGNGDIYLMNVDGSNQHAIVTDGNADLHPTWSPDGSRIAWVRLYPKVRNRPQMGELWQANPDGTNAHALTGPIATPARPVWSPDGAKLAFDADLNEDGYQDLVMGDSNGANLQLFVRADPGQQWWMGTWTLDNNAIFVTERNYAFDGTTVGGLVSTYTRQICLYEPVGCSNITTDSTAMMPDVQSLDITAPVSQVEPLPTWSRLGGFTVQWSGQDVGASGLAAYDVAYRQAADSDWTVWLNGTQPDPALPIGPAGESGAGTFIPPSIGDYYFRSRAIDGAEHLEPWPVAETGDATTTVFSWYLSGRVTDSRGLPQGQYTAPLVPPAMDNITTDTQGTFQVHIGAPGDYTLAEAIQVSMVQDQQRDYYLLPDDNILKNSGFEQPLVNREWMTSGTAALTQSAGQAHSGRQGASIGRACPDDCIVSFPIGNSEQLYNGKLAGAPDGTLHLLARKLPNTLIHLVRTPEGQWLPYGILANGVYGWAPDIVFDQAGDLHLVWSTIEFDSRDYLYYARYRVGTGWTQPTQLGYGRNPKIAVDAQNRPYLLYQCSQGEICPDETLFYRQLTAGGGWAEPIVLTVTKALRSYAIAVAAGIVQVSWAEWPAIGIPERLQVMASSDGEQWNQPTLIDAGFPPVGTGEGRYAAVHLLVDRQATLHLVWMTPTIGQIFYTSKRANGPWSPVEALQADVGASTFSSVEAMLDGDDNLYIIGERFNSQPAFYWRRTVAGTWLPSRVLNMVGDVVLDGLGNFYAFGDESSLRTNAKVEVVERSSLSQIIPIAEDLHQPTFSFLYQITGARTAGTSDFAVTVNNGLTTTQVYSATAETPWRLGWVDMTPWQGETVTVTLAVAQQVGDPYLQVVVDQVTLGSWRTPVPQQVAPNRVAWGESRSVTIHGLNFLATPEVWVGDRSLVDVVLVDDTTVTATIPGDLLPGIYDVLVVNPGGEQHRIFSALGIGEQVYLPIVE